MPSVPISIASVVLTGRYIRPDGTPLTGTLTFEPPAFLTFPGADVIGVGAATVSLDETGAFTTILIATDAAGGDPTDWAYTVVERLHQANGRTFHIQLPTATPVVDLADLAPTDPALGDYVVVAGPPGTPGSKIYAGTGAPSASVGIDGDFYVDTTSGAVTLYGPKTSGAWPTGIPLTSAAPVTSVNAKTGAVSLTAADVGALTQTTADGRYLQLTGGNVSGKIGAGLASGTPAGRLEVVPGDDATAGLVIKSNSTSGTDVIQTKRASDGAVRTRIDRNCQIVTLETAYMAGSGVQIGATATQFGGGVGVLGLTNATTVPTTNPTGAVVLYSEGGVLKIRTAAGAVIDTSVLRPNSAVRSITTATVAAAAWDVLLCDATSNAITVTLPTATAGVVVSVKKTDSSANAVTVTGTIDGVTNPTLTAQYQTMWLVADGTTWRQMVRPTLANLPDYPATSDARYLALAGGTVTGAVTSVRTASTDTVVTAGVSGDTFDRARLLASGRYEVGSGTATRDTAWYRQAANKWGTDADIAIMTAGKGLQVKEGTGAKSGVATLAGGTATVSNTSVTATSRIQLTSQADGGTPGWLRVSTRTAGTSFTITSSSASDTSTVAYFIVEPAS
jgi:hypothetical protein